MNISWQRLIERTSEGEAGGAGGAGGGLVAAAQQQATPPAEGSQPPVAATPPAASAPPAPYVPDGLPDDLKGGSERETIDKLWGNISGREKPPAAASDYKLEVPKELEGVLNPADDKVLPQFAAIAHKHGLTQSQYQNVIVDFHNQLLASGHIEPAVDIQNEFAAIGNNKGDKAASIAAGRKAVADLAGTFDALATRQQISPETAAELKAAVYSAASFKAISDLVALLPKQAGAGPSPGGQPGAPQQYDPLRAMFPTHYQT